MSDPMMAFFCFPCGGGVSVDDASPAEWARAREGEPCCDDCWERSHQMAETSTMVTTAELVAKLTHIAEYVSELPLRLREQDVDALCGAVSWMARVMVFLVEERDAQKHALMHVEEGLGGVASDVRRLGNS